MCITLHASRLSSTKLYAGEALIDGVYHHVLGYKNKASNGHRGPNAMVLPIPAKNALGRGNAYDTRAFKWFLDDICNSTKALTLGMDERRSKGMSRGIEVFDVGSYTVRRGDQDGRGDGGRR